LPPINAPASVNGIVKEATQQNLIESSGNNIVSRLQLRLCRSLQLNGATDLKRIRQILNL